MRAYGLRLPIVFASLLAVLAILFGMQFLLQRQAVSLPLNTRLRDVPGVLGQPTVSSTGSALDVQVRLALVPDLQATYQQLLAAAGAGTSARVNLVLVDDRTAALLADYDQLNVILDQGRATGQFVSMQQSFDAAGKALGLTRAALVLGQNEMFVTLVSGSAYLYEVLPLTLSSGTPGGGGS